jgi:hypothetical protein
VPKSEYVAHFQSDHSIDAGDYPAIVDRWTRRFPSEQLWLGTYDQMVEQPRTLLTSLFSFLDVSTEIDWTTLPTQIVIDRGRPGSDDLVGRRGGGNDLPDDLANELQRIWAPRIEVMVERFGALAEPWRS